MSQIDNTEIGEIEPLYDPSIPIPADVFVVQTPTYVCGSNNNVAMIFVIAQDNALDLTITSPFGNWHHYFGFTGLPGKEFLLTCDKDYLATKFKEHNYLDLLHNSKLILGLINELWENPVEVSELRSTLFNIIRKIEDSSANNDNSGKLFQRLFYESALYQKFPDFEFVFTISPNFEAFMQEFWSGFIYQIKQEVWADMGKNNT